MALFKRYINRLAALFPIHTNLIRWDTHCGARISRFSFSDGFHCFQRRKTQDLAPQVALSSDRQAPRAPKKNISRRRAGSERSDDRSISSMNSTNAKAIVRRWLESIWL